MTQFKPVSFGKYVLLERIGVSPSAELFRAKTSEKKNGNKPVLIKKILPQLTKDKGFIDSLRQAAKVSKRLKHPNIIQVRDFGNVAEAYYIATEYLTGRTLEEVLESSKEQRHPVELSHALHICTEICEGLAYAHSLTDSQGKSRNIIHRDISPQNIFITDAGKVKITEFGSNTEARQDSSSQMGMFKGKVAYMSPEQVDGKAMDCRSDIFSLGVILYEMITGRQAFEGETIQVFSRVRQAQFEPPENIVDDLPSELCQVIRRALEKKPENRYPSASEMLALMKQILSVVSSKPTSSTLIQYLKDLSNNKPDMGSTSQDRPAAAHFKESLKSEKIEPLVKPSLEVFTGEQETNNTDQNELGTAKDDPNNLPEKLPMEPKEISLSIQKSQSSAGRNPISKDHETVPVKQPPQAVNEKQTESSGPVRNVIPEPDKSIVAQGGKEAVQSSAKSHEKAFDQASPAQDKKKSAPSEMRKASPRPKRKTGLWFAVAAVLAVVCIGTTLFMTKQSFQRGSDGIASSKVGHGLKALEDGRFDEAVRLLDQAMASEPDLLNEVSKPYSEALQGKAAAFVKTEPVKAEALLVQAVNFDPESVSAYSQLGLLYLKQKDFARAAGSYETVLQLGGESPDAFFNLGYIYAVTQEYEKAERSYSQVIQLDPPFLDEALFNLAVVQDRLGKRKQCIKNLKLATKANPRNKQASQYLKRMKT